MLLGGDINVYSVARAFWEQYRVKTTCFGKYRTGPAYRSRMIDYHPDPAIDTRPVFLEKVNAFAREHADKKIVLMGCGDGYVALIAQARDAGELEGNIIAPYAPFELMDQAQRKEVFYALCEKHGVPYPHTFTFTRAMLEPAGAPLAASMRSTFPSR